MKPHLTTGLLQSAAAALTAGRLLYLGLGRRFPWLVAWLVYMSVSSFTFAILAPVDLIYLQLYVVAIPLYCIFGILAVRELFELVFGDYPGIRTMGRWVMYGAIVLSTGASSTATKLFWSQTATGRALSWIYYLQLGHRSVVLSLALCIVSLLFSMSRYPLHLGQNIYVSGTFFSAIFLSDTAQSLMDSLGPRLHNYAIDWTTNLLIVACLVAWSVRLRREAMQPGVQRVSFPSPDEEHLLEQLSLLNSLLSRAARRG